MPKSNRPNILFLLSDEHSYRCLSHLDAAGTGEPVRTPTLDALAARGVSFANAYCQYALCTPSRICMLAGRSPMTSGGWGNGSQMTARDTIASTLTDAGYETCLLGKMHLGGNRQFVGFKHRPYGDLTGHMGHQWEPLDRKGGRQIRDRTLDAGVTHIPESAMQERIVAHETIAFVREQTASKPDQPWFCMASFSRPHFPLTAPARFVNRYWPAGVTEPKVGRTGDTAQHPMTSGMIEGFKTDQIGNQEGRKARACYFACVDFLDEVIGDLLATLERDGLLKNTIIVYTSDHGELMGEHGLWWKNSWHEGATRVPLIMTLPGNICSQTITTPVSLADLYPTLCNLVGVAYPEDLDGISLAKAIRSGQEPANRGPVLCFNPRPNWGPGTEHVVVRQGRYKYVRFGGIEPHLLFDLQSDPLEQHNLFNDAAHHDAYDRLEMIVQKSWNFDAARKQDALDSQITESNAIQASGDSGNIYLMPDGKLVDADSALYSPCMVAMHARDVIADMPDESPADQVQRST